jgi:inorganic pyrophosphatase
METRRLVELETFDKPSGHLNVVVETPGGTRNKYKFDESKGEFILHGVLPEGAVFPFEFGFFPSTLGEDGDPLDAIVLLDAPTFVGCLLTVRLIGVIEARQKDENGKTSRNDRLVTVATHAHLHSETKSLSDLDKKVLDEIEHFFVSYNQTRSRVFTPLGRFGPKRARKLIAQGIKAFQKKRQK